MRWKHATGRLVENKHANQQKTQTHTHTNLISRKAELKPQERTVSFVLIGMYKLENSTYVSQIDLSHWWESENMQAEQVPQLYTPPLCHTSSPSGLVRPSSSLASDSHFRGWWRRLVSASQEVRGPELLCALQLPCHGTLGRLLTRVTLDFFIFQAGPSVPPFIEVQEGENGSSCAHQVALWTFITWYAVVCIHVRVSYGNASSLMAGAILTYFYFLRAWNTIDN